MGDPRPFMVNALANADATLEHRSDDSGDASALGKAMVTGFNRSFCAQVKWSGLVAPSGNAPVISIECSNDGKGYSQKAGCFLSMTAASGDTSIAPEHLQQQYWRIHYLPNGAAAGVVTCVVYSH